MANMGTVSVSTQQFPIKRKLQETKKPTHPSDKSPEWLALNSPFHFPLRRTSCVPPVWPQIMTEAFSMMGEAHERTIITRERTVKNLYSSSGFSAIRTRSEEQLKTANDELARAISKFNTHLSIFLWKNVSTEVGCDLAQPFEGGFQVFEIFSGQNVGVREIVGFFECFVTEPENVEAGFVAVDEFVVIKRARYGDMKRLRTSPLILP